jgi:DNA-binding response OmpR family regulator
MISPYLNQDGSRAFPPNSGSLRLGPSVRLMKKKFTVLIADRNKNVRDFLRREFSAEGYEIITARDGNQVLQEIARDTPPDLIILDLEIPDADNSEILEKAQTRNPPLPVIIHTFLTEETDRDNQSETEIYIEKSGNIDHLKSAVADMLQRFNPELS